MMYTFVVAIKKYIVVNKANNFLIYLIIYILTTDAFRIGFIIDDRIKDTRRRYLDLFDDEDAIVF